MAVVAVVADVIVVDIFAVEEAVSSSWRVAFGIGIMVSPWRVHLYMNVSNPKMTVWTMNFFAFGKGLAETSPLVVLAVLVGFPSDYSVEALVTFDAAAAH